MISTKENQMSDSLFIPEYEAFTFENIIDETICAIEKKNEDPSNESTKGEIKWLMISNPLFACDEFEIHDNLMFEDPNFGLSKLLVKEVVFFSVDSKGEDFAVMKDRSAIESQGNHDDKVAT